MAVTYQTSSRYESATGQSSYSPTHNLLTGQGNQRMVVVTLGWEDDNVGSASSVTFDGNTPDGSLSATGGTGYSAYAWVGWWFDSNLPATTGNKTIVVTCTEAIQREIGVHVMEFTGVHQTATVNTNTDTRTTAGDVSCSVTVDVDDSLAVGTFACGSTGYGTPTNLTSRQASAMSSSAAGCGSNENVDGASITLGWTSLSTRGAFVGAVFQPYVDLGWTHDINSVPNANLGKVNSVSRANIAKVNQT